jgi:hypothetical protein
MEDTITKEEVTTEQTVKAKPMEFMEEFLCFLIPIAGIIMYLVLNETKPAKAKLALSISLWSMFLGIMFSIAFLMRF